MPTGAFRVDPPAHVRNGRRRMLCGCGVLERGAWRAGDLTCLVGCANCGARAQAARRSRVGVRGVGKQGTPRWVARGAGAGEEEKQGDVTSPVAQADDEPQLPSDAKVVRVWHCSLCGVGRSQPPVNA